VKIDVHNHVIPEAALELLRTDPRIILEVVGPDAMRERSAVGAG
jgi:hypothetical protein